MNIIDYATNNDLEGVRKEIEAGISVDLQNEFGVSLILASDNDNEEIVKLLIEAGARSASLTEGRSEAIRRNVDFVGVHGCSALMCASINGNKEIVELLITAGSTLDLQNKQCGHNALIWASAYGYKDVVELLIEAGATLDLEDIYGHNALWIAYIRGHKEIIEMLRKAIFKIIKPCVEKYIIPDLCNMICEWY